MNRTQYIFLTALLLLLTGCGKHPMPEFEGENQGNRPIEFGISSDLSVESKTVIDENNYTSHRFMVQAGLTVDSWKTNAVFGTDETNEPNGIEVTYKNGDWGYSPARYWQTGSYVFAGAMPSSAGFSVSLDEATHKTLTLDFGDGGYDLRAGQDDIMVGFRTVDVQSTASTSQVDFTFAHQLALVVIEGASKDSNTQGIQVDEITVYGNSASTVGDISFTYGTSGITADYELVEEKTSKDNVYKTIVRPDDLSNAEDTEDWQLVAPGVDGPVYDVLVPELIVFPEACTFNIVVKYTEGANQKIMKGVLSANWAPGKKYTCKFNLASDISFSVEVADWGDPEPVGDVITII